MTGIMNNRPTALATALAPRAHLDCCVSLSGSG